jgi:hypothetical protein
MCLHTDEHMKQSEIDLLYERYLNTADPTEYRFAVKHLGSWAKWEALCSKEPIKDLIENWRRELEVKLRSEALQRIMEVASNEGTRDSLQANRYLLEANYGNKDKVGRPSKQAALAEAKKIVQHQNQVAADYKRIFNE